MTAQDDSSNPTSSDLNDPSARGMAKLIDVVRELSLARSLDEITVIVRRASRQIANSDGATFVLRDGDFCFYADEDAIEPLWKGQRFPLETCVSGWSMLNRQPVVIADIYSDDRVPKDAYRPTFVKSLTMVPIRADSPIGAIGNYWAKPHVSSPEEVRLLQALADTVSVAMENVQLYSDLADQVEELQHANRAKDEFLMLLSHELRTPLNSILGWSQQLLNEGSSEGGGSAGARKTALETIRRNARLQSRIVDDLLDSTRILTGTLSIDRKTVNLTEIVRLAITTMLPIAEAKKIKFETHFTSEKVTILGDPLRLQQAIYNVLSNAVKFSPTESSVRIELDDASATWATLRIRDQGEGISAEFLPKVFDRFSQNDLSVTRRHGGLGIGLSITKAIIDAHGGMVRAKSEGPGKGSEFVFTMARVVSEEIAPKKKVAAPIKETPLHGLRILAIDDDEDSRALVAHVLKSRGAEVTSASGAADAFRQLQHFDPDLIICDLSMPVEDGFSFIRRMRATGEEKISVLPAIAFSAFADVDHETEALAAGFDSFVPKPLEIEKLTKKILELSGPESSL